MTARVLVVDDDADVQFLARLHLERAGYAVDTAASAEAALEVLDDFGPDVILLDLRMPGMGGLGFMRMLAGDGRLEKLAVIVVSSHAAAETVDEVMALGCRSYVRKPFSGAELREAVAQVVASPPA